MPKVEATAGTAETGLTRADSVVCRSIDAYSIRRPETVEREIIKPYFGASPEYTSRESSAITIVTDLMGGGLDTTNVQSPVDPLSGCIITGLRHD